jgi:hypothetical protein
MREVHHHGSLASTVIANGLAAGTQAPFQISGHGHIEGAEPKLLAHILPLGAERGVHSTHETTVFRGLDGTDHFSTHPSEGSGDHHRDRSTRR